MKNLRLLALDTATEACSVALLYQGEITYLNELAQRTHTKRILPMIDQLLAQSGINLTALDGLVFGRGPGSFTGVRVAAGITQGLAFGADLPVIAVSNLTAMAQAAYEQDGALQVAAAIDARMNEVYFSLLQGQKVRSEWGEFIQWETEIAEQVASPELVLQQLNATQRNGQNCHCVGTGWQAYTPLAEFSQNKTANITLPDARYMLPLALEKWAKKEVISAVEIEPIYLRNDVAWQKIAGRE